MIIKFFVGYSKCPFKFHINFSKMWELCLLAMLVKHLQCLFLDVILIFLEVLFYKITSGFYFDIRCFLILRVTTHKRIFIPMWENSAETDFNNIKYYNKTFLFQYCLYFSQQESSYFWIPHGTSSCTC